MSRLDDVYRDLHAHPELSFAERRTAGVAATWLREWGHEVEDGIGVTGVVGVLTRGEGPVVLLRAAMDALPVEETTGLPYASTLRALDPDGVDVPVMHACGHDMHVTCLMGAAATLARSSQWAGTLIVLFQPAEEVARGASAMVADRLLERVPRPDVVLGQHVAPLPAGALGLRSGPAFAATDSLRVILTGAGGHGSRPEATVDPVVMAASTVMRLQTIVSREVAGADTAVLTVGASRAGHEGEHHPGARRAAPQRTDQRAALESVVGVGGVVDPGPVTGSEDVGVLASAAGAPCVFWLLGGADPATFGAATDVDAMRRVMASLPSNHSPAYAPVIRPTLDIGSRSLTAAALTWLGPA